MDRKQHHCMQHTSEQTLIIKAVKFSSERPFIFQLLPWKPSKIVSTPPLLCIFITSYLLHKIYVKESIHKSMWGKEGNRK